MAGFILTVSEYLSKITFPLIGITDILEILLISFFIYQFMVWIRQTRAYSLLKGILVLVAFMIVVYFLRMNTILWIFRNLASVLIISIIIIFQPELRKILEQLGRRRFMAGLLSFDNGREVQERFTDTTINELIKACFDMGEAYTGALIAIEQEVRLTDIEGTGIIIDGIVTSQLLINIFEHNTPLHDGAVLIRGNRVAAATCYLPLSDNMALSKQLGTRHRAGVGLSENTDSLVIIVSEETGKVSYAQHGKLYRDVNSTALREALVAAQGKRFVDKRLRQFLKSRRLKKLISESREDIPDEKTEKKSGNKKEGL